MKSIFLTGNSGFVGVNLIEYFESYIFLKYQRATPVEINQDVVIHLAGKAHDLKNTSPWFIDCLANDRDNLIAYLKNKGIGSRPMYPPINGQKIYKTNDYFPNSELIGKKGLWLPSAVQLKDDEVTRICLEINNFYNKK